MIKPVISLYFVVVFRPYQEAFPVCVCVFEHVYIWSTWIVVKDQDRRTWCSNSSLIQWGIYRYMVLRRRRRRLSNTCFSVSQPIKIILRSMYILGKFDFVKYLNYVFMVEAIRGNARKVCKESDRNCYTACKYLPIL